MEVIGSTALLVTPLLLLIAVLLIGRLRAERRARKSFDADRRGGAAPGLPME